MNTAAHSAGRVCYPSKDDAYWGDHREHPGWSGATWWPGSADLPAPGRRADGVPLSAYALRLYYGLPT